MDLSLLKTYDGPEKDRQDFEEELSDRQIIRGWNARVAHKDPDGHGFKSGTKPAKEFALGWSQCDQYLETLEVPEIRKGLLHKKPMGQEYTIAEILKLEIKYRLTRRDLKLPT